MFEAIKDKYGWAVIIRRQGEQDYRSAMPDETTARVMAQSSNMLMVLEGVNNCWLVKDGINGQKMWHTHDALIQDVERTIRAAKCA